MTCPRCNKDKILAFRVHSDVIDMLVCAVCAYQALDVGETLYVDRVGDKDVQK